MSGPKKGSKNNPDVRGKSPHRCTVVVMGPTGKLRKTVDPATCRASGLCKAPR